MGTIIARKRKDGSVGYTAQVRIMRGGKKAHTESQTFDRKQAAAAWLKKRETELSEPGALDATHNPVPLLRDVINTYLDQVSQTRNFGRTKKFTLRAIARHPFGATPINELSSAALVAYVQQRIAEDRVLPQIA